MSSKKLVILCSNSFEEVRCECGALLFKALKKPEGSIPTVEVKCRKCGKLTRW